MFALLRSLNIGPHSLRSKRIFNIENLIVSKSHLEIFFPFFSFKFHSSSCVCVCVTVFVFNVFKVFNVLLWLCFDSEVKFNGKETEKEKNFSNKLNKKFVIFFFFEFLVFEFFYTAFLWFGFDRIFFFWFYKIFCEIIFFSLWFNNASTSSRFEEDSFCSPNLFAGNEF